MAKTAEEPIHILAMIVCDAIARDECTGRLTAQGLFINLIRPSFPYVHESVAVYAAMSDVRGNVAVRVQLVNSDGAVIVPGHNMALRTASPVDECQFVARMLGVKFEKPGIYYVQLFANDAFIMERRIVLMPGPLGPPPLLPQNPFPIAPQNQPR